MSAPLVLAAVALLCAIVCAGVAWRTYRVAEMVAAAYVASRPGPAVAPTTEPKREPEPAPPAPRAPPTRLGACVVCRTFGIVVAEIDIGCARCQRRWTGPVCPRCVSGPVPLMSQHPGCTFGWRTGAVA